MISRLILSSPIDRTEAEKLEFIETLTSLH